jgi:hypothetical protein
MPEVFPKKTPKNILRGLHLCRFIMWGFVVELEAHCLHKWKAEFLFAWLLAKHGCSSKQTGEARTIMSLTCSMGLRASCGY